ncbi:MAG: AI-2E family transporter [Burkholderiales bacterium]|nr:AI-2E family transporter [Phycisphaerae bacterium]
MQRINARWLALLAITLIALYLCWLIVSPFIQVILWAVVLAIIAFPYHVRLQNRGVNPTIAAMLSTAGVVLVVLLPVMLILIAMAAQIPTQAEMQEGIAKMRSLLDDDGAIYKRIDPYFDLDWLQDTVVVKQRLSPIAGMMAQQSLSIVGNIASTAISILFALFTLFYFLRDSKTIGDAVAGALPLEESQSRAVFAKCKSIIQASVQGVILIAAIQGVLAGLAFWILGVPSPIFLAVLLFILSMVPAVGSALVWVPAVLYLLATGHWVKAIELTVWCGGVVGMVDNLLRPRLVGKKTGMHDLVIFFSVLGGLQVFGILGLFVGPVVVAVALSIVEVFKEASHNWQASPQKVVVDPGKLAPAVVIPAAGHPMEVDLPHTD